MSILFHSLFPGYSVSCKKEIKNWLKIVASIYEKNIGDVNIIFLDDEKMLEMNQKYLRHNYYTDTISFDYSDEKKISGDIFISVERVKKNAVKYNCEFHEELLRIIIHSVFHLLGFEDKTKIGKDKMRSLEGNALDLFYNFQIR